MKILNWIVRRLEKFLEKHNRFYVIHSNYKGDPTPYLVRYILFKSKLFSIYIHRFLLSDDEVPHDHPFNFFTYIAGDIGYIEARWEKTEDGVKKIQGTRRMPGTWAYRRKNDIHRVMVVEDHSLEEKEKAPLSICLIGPIKTGSWGFYPDGEFVLAGEFLDDAHVKINNIPEKWRD